MTTAVQVQYRRGTATQVASFTGAQGELIVDTTNNRVVVQDGSTAGGWPAARLAEIPAGPRNAFRNGAMDVWQRGTSSTTVTTAGAYTADGWIVVPSGASCGAQAGAGRLLTAKSLQVYGGTGVTDVVVKQRMESFVAARLTSQTVTVQAYVYNNTGGALTPALTVKHAVSVDNWTSPVTDVNAVSLQSCAAGAWTLVGYTFVDAGYAANGLEVSFDFGNNFSASGKSIQLAECDISVTPALSTGLNSAPPRPELRSIASELGFCQRYFSTNFANGTTPTNNSALQLFAGLATSTTQIQVFTAAFPLQMRAVPTMTFYSPDVGTPTNGCWSWTTGGSWTAATATSSGGATTAVGIVANMTTSGITAGNLYEVAGMWAASAEL